jgi:hypothetical protein
MLMEKPFPKVMKYAEYTEKNRFLRIEDCQLSDTIFRPVNYSLFSMNMRIFGLSFSYNPDFRDESMRQLIDILPEMKLLRTLEL